jgi:hypothetical protein
MKDFDRIVSYGCSHMAALETVDIEYHPDADQIKEKHGYPFFRRLLGENKDFDYLNYVEKGKQYSWPVLLSKKLNVKCVNRAFPANSIYKIIYDFEYDRSAGSLSDKDLILVDLVSPFRLIDFSDEKKINTFNLNLPISWSGNLKDGSEYFLKLFNDDFCTFYYLMALNYLSSYKNTYQIYFTIPIRDHIFQFINSNNYTLREMRQKIISEIDLITTVSLMNDCVFDKKIEKYYGHAKPIAHERYAEKMYQEITKLIN